MSDWTERYRYNQMLRKLVAGLKTHEEVALVLTHEGIEYEDVSEEYGYLNIRIPRENGYIRIWKPYRSDELEVNSFDSVPMRYSGIPTFEPSGRRSL